MVEHSYDLITVTGPDRALRYASPAFTRIFGDAIAPHLGRPMWELVHPDDRARLGEIFADLKARPGGVAEFEFRIFRADGAERWLRVCQTNLLEDPKLGGFVGNATDITEIRAAAETKEKLRLAQSIAEVVSLHKALMATLSHGGGLTGMATTVSRVVGGRVVVEDLEGRRSASPDPDHPEVGSPPEWRHLDSTNAVRVGNWLVATASQSGEVLGAVSMFDPDGMADQRAASALEQAATVLIAEVFRQRAIAETELKVWGDLASEIIDDPKPARAMRHATTLGYDFTRPHRVVLIAREGSEVGQMTVAVRRVARNLGLTSNLVTPRAAGVALLSDATVDWEEFGLLLGRELSLVPRIGVGGLYPPGELHKSLKEAELALRLGRGTVVQVDQLGILGFLATDADPDRLQAMIDRWIGPLVEHDLGHRSALVDTLARFLGQQGSIQSAAQSLHVHPSTIKYRLKQIKAFTGRDLDDADQRFNLEFACRALRVLKVLKG
jgi:PAS domain S-box-containing protein